MAKLHSHQRSVLRQRNACPDTMGARKPSRPPPLISAWGFCHNGPVAFLRSYAEEKGGKIALTIQIWIISDDDTEEHRIEHVARLVRDTLDEEGMIYAQGETRNTKDSGKHLYLTDIQ